MKRVLTFWTPEQHFRSPSLETDNHGTERHQNGTKKLTNCGDTLNESLIVRPFVQTSPKVCRHRPSWLPVHWLAGQNSRCSIVRIARLGSSPWRSRRSSVFHSLQIGAMGANNRGPRESRKTRGLVQYGHQSRSPLDPGQQRIWNKRLKNVMYCVTFHDLRLAKYQQLFKIAFGVVHNVSLYEQR